ncbi:hypothetical protein GCM10023237_09350 [Streptomyces coeruleoprunus]
MTPLEMITSTEASGRGDGLHLPVGQIRVGRGVVGAGEHLGQGLHGDAPSGRLATPRECLIAESGTSTSSCAL